MKHFKFKAVLHNNGWMKNQFITVNNEGIIEKIGNDVPAGEITDLNCFALPGFQNAHSHSFQYAMAGLAERHSTEQTPDDFWSWREAMYKLALSVNPDQFENIATMLYAEMLRHGYTNVAEFHYVHHDKNGMPYDNLSEMGERMVKAAKNAGIGITLIPIFYQKGGFGVDPKEGQKRFISPDIERYYALLDASKKSCEYYEHANVAIGIHSMRGVEPAIIKEVAQNGPQDLPFHIHISEQKKEVEDAIEYLGKRPVEWMLDNIVLSERFHLVHATHLTPEEKYGIARSGANVVLCPSTEGNLGDGIFPLRSYQQGNGNWSIGTDSHVGLNPLEELRILDYGQRLTSHKRNTYYSKEEGDSGTYAIKMSQIAGRKAMNNFETEYFKIGTPLNAALINANSPLILSTELENLTSTILYSSDISMQYGTISHGVLNVANGIHKDFERIASNFVQTIKELGNR